MVSRPVEISIDDLSIKIIPPIATSWSVQSNVFYKILSNLIENFRTKCNLGVLNCSLNNVHFARNLEPFFYSS